MAQPVYHNLSKPQLVACDKEKGPWSHTPRTFQIAPQLFGPFTLLYVPGNFEFDMTECVNE